MWWGRRAGTAPEEEEPTAGTSAAQRLKRGTNPGNLCTKNKDKEQKDKKDKTKGHGMKKLFGSQNNTKTTGKASNPSPHKKQRMSCVARWLSWRGRERKEEQRKAKLVNITVNTQVGNGEQGEGGESHKSSD